MYEQIEAVQKGMDLTKSKLVSMVINEVRSITRKSDYLIISLFTKLNDTDSLGLCIGDKDFYFEDGQPDGYSVYFDEYDEQSMTVRAYPSDKLMEIINNHSDEDIKIIVDMKWLIKLTLDCFTEYGDRIGYPVTKPSFVEDADYTFPAGSTPSEEQRKAVKTILNSRLSYIWGAPGTGKTQYVLATSIIAYIRKGGRVAIIAPTNNSVEQVLNGVLKVIEQDDPEHEYIDPEEDILRMGSATAGFIKEHPGMCEDRARMKRIKQLRQSNKIIANLIFERKVESLKPKFELIQRLYNEGYDAAPYIEKKEIESEIRAAWDEIVAVVKQNNELIGLVSNVDLTNLRSRADGICKTLMNRSRPELDIEQYQEMTDSELRELIFQNNEELMELEPYDTAVRMRKVKVMAMTPFILMSRRRSMFDDGGIVDVNHIFIDEAGYANLIQTMPVFMCGPPIAMLGDHMQLPPVCELEKDNIRTWIERDDYMKYSFMWDQSARYIESYLFGTIEDARDDYLYDREPRFEETQTANLTSSHRFANNLAKILDDCVYMNGISGSAGTLEMYCYDVKGLNPETRENLAEAEAITEFVKKNESNLGDFAIITPYSDQRKSLIKKLKAHERRIMTIHGSQGKEWDTVIISVSDNGTSSKQVPYRFTSSLPPYDGLKVINTAVSRAKKRLIIFCDYEFWKQRAVRGDLLGRLVADTGTIVIPIGGDASDYIDFVGKREDTGKNDPVNIRLTMDSSRRIVKLRRAFEYGGMKLFSEENHRLKSILKDAGVTPSDAFVIAEMTDAAQNEIERAIATMTILSEDEVKDISARVGINEAVTEQLISDIVEAFRLYSESMKSGNQPSKP